MNIIEKIVNKVFGRSSFNSLDYWENRYFAGGNSGDGSYGRLSQFKADFINTFIEQEKITSATEFGCGDGHQLSLINYPSYTGLDISATIVKLCRVKFSNDEEKTFIHYKPHQFKNGDIPKADLTLSLDVLYHVVEGGTYKKYLSDLFSASNRYVIIYSTNFNLYESEHILHRKFTDDIPVDIKQWKQILHVPNPFTGVGEQHSKAEFYVFKKS